MNTIDMKKINEALKEFNDLEVLKLQGSPADNQLMVIFYCSRGGGMYEDASLTMKFNCVEAMHLPTHFYTDQYFSLYLCNKEEATAVVPECFYEPSTTDHVVKFLVDGEDANFYIYFEELEWFLEGANIKNRHELLSEKEMFERYEERRKSNSK